jgi:hypothetical protein
MTGGGGGGCDVRPTDWAVADYQRRLRLRENGYNSTPVWPRENGKTGLFDYPDLKTIQYRTVSDPATGEHLRKQVYQTKIHPAYVKRTYRKPRSCKSQTKYIDKRLINDGTDMAGTTTFLENMRLEAALPKKSYNNLNLKEYSVSELKLKQFKTLSLLAQEIELSYKPLSGMRPKKKSSYNQTQSMQRLFAGKSSGLEPGEEAPVRRPRKIGWS